MAARGDTPNTDTPAPEATGPSSGQALAAELAAAQPTQAEVVVDPQVLEAQRIAAENLEAAAAWEKSLEGSREPTAHQAEAVPSDADMAEYTRGMQAYFGAAQTPDELALFLADYAAGNTLVTRKPRPDGHLGALVYPVDADNPWALALAVSYNQREEQLAEPTVVVETAASIEAAAAEASQAEFEAARPALEALRAQTHDYLKQIGTIPVAEEYLKTVIRDLPLVRLSKDAAGRPMATPEPLANRITAAQAEIVASEFNSRIGELLAEKAVEDGRAAEAALEAAQRAAGMDNEKEKPDRAEQQRQELLQFQTELRAKLGGMSKLGRLLGEADEFAEASGDRPALIILKDDEADPTFTAIENPDPSDPTQVRYAQIVAQELTARYQVIRADLDNKIAEQRNQEAEAAASKPEAKQPDPKTPESKPKLRIPESLDKPLLKAEVTDDFKQLVAELLSQATTPGEVTQLLVDRAVTQKHFDRAIGKMVIDRPGYLRFNADTGEFALETVAGRRSKGSKGAPPQADSLRSAYLYNEALAAVARLEEVGPKAPDTASALPKSPDLPPPIPKAQDVVTAPKTPDVVPIPAAPKKGERLVAPPSAAEVSKVTERERVAEERQRAITEAETQRLRNNEIVVTTEMAKVRPDMVERVRVQQESLNEAATTFARVSAEEAGNTFGSSRVEAFRRILVERNDALTTAKAELEAKFLERNDNAAQLYGEKSRQMEAVRQPVAKGEAATVVAFKAINGDPAMTTRIAGQLLRTTLASEVFTEIRTNDKAKGEDGKKYVEKILASQSGIIRIDRWDKETGQLAGMVLGRLPEGSRAGRNTLAASLVRQLGTLDSERAGSAGTKLKRLGGARKLAAQMRESLSATSNEPGRAGLEQPAMAAKLRADVRKGFTARASALAIDALAALNYGPQEIADMKLSKKLVRGSAWLDTLNYVPSKPGTPRVARTAVEIGRTPTRKRRAASTAKLGVVTTAKAGARAVKTTAEYIQLEAKREIEQGKVQAEAAKEARQVKRAEKATAKAVKIAASQEKADREQAEKLVREQAAAQAASEQAIRDREAQDLVEQTERQAREALQAVEEARVQAEAERFVADAVVQARQGTATAVAGETGSVTPTPEPAPTPIQVNSEPITPAAKTSENALPEA